MQLFKDNISFNFPSGLTATPTGPAPTVSEATTVLFEVSITDPLPLSSFGIYAYGPAGEALFAIAVDEKRIKIKITAAEIEAH